MLSLTSNTPTETRRLGERVARFLRPGDVILLQGQLGAGKTCFAQGIGRGLKVIEPVKSSSFVLVNEYNGRLKVYHADLFRLNQPEEVADLALEESSADGVLLIEWPDRAESEMPPERLLIKFEVMSDRGRTLIFEPAGKRYEEMVESLDRAVAARAKA